jgi:hypothetical protein
MKTVIALSVLVVCGNARADPMHLWCADDAPIRYTWKKELIQPPLSELIIDKQRRTVRFENANGDVLIDLTDGRTYDSSDPQVGCKDIVVFPGEKEVFPSEKEGSGSVQQIGGKVPIARSIHGIVERILAPNYRTDQNRLCHGYNTDTVLVYSEGQLTVGAHSAARKEYCAETPDQAIKLLLEKRPWEVSK